MVQTTWAKGPIPCFKSDEDIRTSNTYDWTRRSRVGQSERLRLYEERRVEKRVRSMIFQKQLVCVPSDRVKPVDGDTLTWKSRC